MFRSAVFPLRAVPRVMLSLGVVQRDVVERARDGPHNCPLWFLHDLLLLRVRLFPRVEVVLSTLNI